MKLIARACIAPLIIATSIALAAASCNDPSSQNPPPASSHPNSPATASTYCSIFDTSCGPQPSSTNLNAIPNQPIPSADAANPFKIDPYFVLGLCHLYLSPPDTGGIKVTDGIHVDGGVIIMCATAPRTHTITIRLQKKDSTTGGWIDEFPPYISLKIPRGANLPSVHVVTSLCYPGVWSMYIAVAGIGSDGLPFSAEGRTPAQRLTCK